MHSILFQFMSNNGIHFHQFDKVNREKNVTRSFHTFSHLVFKRKAIDSIEVIYFCNRFVKFNWSHIVKAELIDIESQWKIYFLTLEVH